MMKKVDKTITGLSKVKKMVKSMTKVSDETKTILKSATLTSVITSVCFGLVVSNGSYATNSSNEDINQMKYQIAVLTNELELLLKERSHELGIGDYPVSDLYYSVKTQVSSKPIVSIDAIEEYIGIRAKKEPKLRIFVGYAEEIYKSAVLSKIEPGIFLISLLDSAKTLDESDMKRNNPGNVAKIEQSLKDANRTEYGPVSFASLEEGILAAGKDQAEDMKQWDVVNIEDLSELSTLNNKEVTDEVIEENTKAIIKELKGLYQIEQRVKRQSKL
ncbi:hypothetical protein [Bacillus bombysepticus]|uniref:hypothetical protein n=1 Tax=Bacillus bombysepticus TaxID=658666 RepID=UPI00301AFF5C